MAESTTPSDVFNELAYEFAERLRHGERPSLTEYTDRHPDLAGEIRDLFPMLAIVEQMGTVEDGGSNPSDDKRASENPIPERLGDYRILREIGRGGMGIVYEAEQESLGRHVALKVLTQNRHVGSVQLLRFQREARAVALLHHTNIVPVFGVGEDDGAHYYAMQYIHGRSMDVVLRELVKLKGDSTVAGSVPHGGPENVSTTLAKGLLTNRFWAQPAGSDAMVADLSRQPLAGASTTSLSPGNEAAHSLAGTFASPSSKFGRNERSYYRTIARLGVQAAEALAHAHSHGVMHRDIKPSNLLLDLQGIIWLTDFGLAKAEGAADLTSPGDVVGTLRYMAPERFQGQSNERCDIYSLGVSLYEMLTLKPAFPASQRPRLINSIIDSEPVRPSKLDPRIPRDLETIVLKAIANDSSDRFASAGEMAKELSRFVEGRPIRSRRVTIPERLWRWSRRNPAVASLTVLTMLLTTVLATISTTAAWKFRDQRDQVRNEQRNTQVELGRSLLSQGRALRYSRQPGRRAEGLKILTKAASIARDGRAPTELMEKLRDESIATLAEDDERPVQTWQGVELRTEKASLAFDAGRYVVLTNDGSLHVYRLEDQVETQVVKPDPIEPRLWPLFVPGGRFVITISGSRNVKLWDLERNEVPTAWPTDVRCSTSRPDGRQIAVVRNDGEIRVFDLPSITEAARFKLGADFPKRLWTARMALSHDGRFVAVVGADSPETKVFEVASGRVVLEVKSPPARVYRNVALSRNGGLLGVSHDRAISIYDVANGDRLAMLQGHQSEGINAQFQPGGNLLASVSWDGTTRLWDPIRGRLLVTLAGSFHGWLGNGSQLVISRDRSVVLYQTVPAAERKTIDCRMLSDRAGAALYGPARVAFTPDGQMIAMALRPEGVRIVRASDGVGLAHLPIGYCDEVAYLPDGSLLTCNDRGLCRWPVQRLAASLKMGPPEPLTQIDVREGYVHLGLTTDRGGQRIGIPAPFQFGSLLLDAKQPWRRTWLAPHRFVTDVMISPNGRWAATTGMEASRENAVVKIWETATGQLQAELPAGHFRPAFSPDSRWLAVQGASCYRLFRTGSWSPGPEIVCGLPQGDLRMAFHPNGELAAVVDPNRSVVRLIEVTTGRVVAALESPHESNLYCVVFSPDGRVIAASHTDQRVELWDLSSIRRRLEELSLAGGIPDVFVDAPIRSERPTVDRIDLVGADPTSLKLLPTRHELRQAGFAIRGLLDTQMTDAIELRVRALRWQRMGQWRLALRDYRASWALRPDFAHTANNLAWCLVVEPGRGGADEAVRMARKAVELAPKDLNFRNTLGAALYRADRFADAIVELESNIAKKADSSAYDLVFMAMCKQRLDKTEAARNDLAQARQWRLPAVGPPPVLSVEFQRLLDEATAVVEQSLQPLPAEVFAH